MANNSKDDWEDLPLNDSHDDWVDVADHKGPELSLARQFADTTADYLPELGGMAGGILGTPADIVAGPGGNIAGAALGGALGKAGQNLYNSYMRPELAPKKGSDYLSGPVTDGVIQGALSGVGEGIPIAGKAIASSPVGQRVASTLSPVGKYIAEKGKFALGKLGQLATGVEGEALTRQLERPAQTAAMEADDAVFNLGQQGIKEIEERGKTLGENVAGARQKLINSEGTFPVAQAERDRIVSEGESFLKRNRPSKSGYSAISPEQTKEYAKYLNDIKSGNVEDFVKMREHFDHVEALANKYGAQSLTPYERELIQLRGKMNEVLKAANPEFKGANEAFEKFAGNRSTLGLNSESKAESVFDNLYGANKTGKQQAAEEILSPKTFESAKDIAANKTIANAKGPAGSEFGLRNMIRIGGAVPTMGASILLTSPKAWKNGLRGLGRLGESLGSYGPILANAAARSPQALAATYSILAKDPEFKKLIESIDPELFSAPTPTRKIGSVRGKDE